jgi:hypothetical protein
MYAAWQRERYVLQSMQMQPACTHQASECIHLFDCVLHCLPQLGVRAHGIHVSAGHLHEVRQWQTAYLVKVIACVHETEGEDCWKLTS